MSKNIRCIARGDDAGDQKIHLEDVQYTVNSHTGLDLTVKKKGKKVIARIITF